MPRRLPEVYLARARIKCTMRIRLRQGGIVFTAALFLFIALLAVFVGVFARRGDGPIGLSLTYHFLVRRCDHATAAAVAGDAYLAGGAGYLLENEGLVVLAGYYSKEDATYVGHTMSERGVEVSVVTRTLDDFSTGREHAALRGQIEDELTTLDALSRLLFDAANGLERGLGQQDAHAALQGAAASLDGLVGGNEGEYFKLWNVELLRIKRRAKETDAGLVFAKDLRYLQVAILVTILRAPVYFS